MPCQQLGNSYLGFRQREGGSLPSFDRPGRTLKTLKPRNIGLGYHFIYWGVAKW